MGIPLFLDFFYRLRQRGIPVGAHNWLALIEALQHGLHENSLDTFYQVSRCILVDHEGHYDAFDRTFLETFRGVELDREEVLSQLEEWLRDPAQLMALDPAMRAALETLGIDELRKRLLERLAEQKKRHEGGSKWVGTGGTSPFGQGGAHPSGVRIGGQGGGRSALAVADARRFRAFRRDLVLDTRQIAAALRRLRRLSRKEGEEELDIDETIDRTARNAGDIEVVMRPPRKNDIRMLLLLDVGGSMDPHAHRISQLFSAAYQGGGFRELRSYYFHNCVYARLYEDAAFTKAVALDELLNLPGPSWHLVMVGDAWMHPGELTLSGGSFWDFQRGPSGLRCLAKLADRFPRAAWLNPENKGIWDAPTIREIAGLFPMYELTLEGLSSMVEGMRQPPNNRRLTRVRRLLSEGRGAK